MKKIIVLSSLLLLTLCFVACKKNQLGGKSTIKGSVLHHSQLIPNATVYVKFNAKDFPGTDIGAYDDKVTADANGNYEIKCYKGDYYLYGVGYDNSIREAVTGGLAVHIRNRETVKVDVAVTE